MTPVPKTRLWLTPERDKTPPIPLSPEDEYLVLRTAVTRLGTVVERTAGVGLLMDGFPDKGADILVEAIRTEQNTDLRATEIRLLGVYQRPGDLPLLSSLLDDANSTVRAAAIDAIGTVHWPAFRIPNRSQSSFIRVETTTQPPIPLPFATERFGRFTMADDQRRQLPPDLLNRFWKTILESRSTEEREAAGRAVAKWQGQPDYRVAEWGVWIARTDASFVVSQSVLDEIPPFVHQTGDRHADFRDYLTMPDMISKPIVHITTRQPLVLNFCVRIEQGRPWYAYPLPDDYVVESGYGHGTVARMDNTALARLPDARTGYKWASPPHDTAPSYGGVGPMHIDTVGLRWQTLIVSPERLSWMIPPVVPSDDKYSWWTALRDVPSAWVSSRGEAERFLYYDGPTSMTSWWTISMSDGELQIAPSSTSNRPYPSGFETPLKSISSNDAERGMFVGIDPAGRPTAAVLTLAPPSRVPAAALSRLEGAAVEPAFLKLLLDAGLTAAEAGGLLDSWRQQFFKTPGRRFVRVMSAQEYDRLCPINIAPPPTELVRVGLVLTEFGMS